MTAARTLSLAGLLGALVFPGGCGADGTHTNASPAPPRPAPPHLAPPRRAPPAGVQSGSAGAACRTGARSVCVTSRANGRTITLAVGWRLEVDLSSPNGIWSGPVEQGPRLLGRLGAARQAGGGVRVAYGALARGRTELRAFERPLCPPARACPQFILSWALHVRVGEGRP